MDGPQRLSPNTQKQGRRRRSSSIIYQEPAESIEHTSDQAALPNLNANWVNAKGELSLNPSPPPPPNVPTEPIWTPWTRPQLAEPQDKADRNVVARTGAWTIHFVLIAALKILFDIIPGVSQETSWTLTNISYMFGSFLMFHWVRGIPFEFNAGAYDNLNMWEQIDNGDQYTPTKKFLLCVPIVLFLLSTHYTHYDLTYFTINFLATLAVVIPKLPFSHRLRIGLFSDLPEDS
ncbi:Protein ORM1 [Penicillium macrosclerotiorum]|uniref:Protein ORM1 n=1 Tax=Penicillium macrosclerotiorum TaxID=303699 RepID=UPI00254957AC|nr:Protein ORM1 [Penicillium macrosclerotiorum]KAJ5679623.1 Protein ORM1 [Penicillium macrosclerotiorum]